ncbi:Leucine-rich repeat-containing protein ODA7 [Trypanosoma rangeli]|uniref:Leucine-rich repeat-containing protein ODA7 n=1 Tax=Trypanosoma rangeli TaxID=5698 RepID=A0A3R7KFT3_TRYRA|nr:Leucine-rich repeat-containing protein ODA7 [Trypanosoma rangeli]RNF05632.1 Leucine-rich repeat-containing protein ODA7 [Trypanosoma rangeli]|eukprot:RNF05632.1 Leucine-rich repeat-containing protein ODA7 [Trypanosoma rangeli]
MAEMTKEVLIAACKNNGGYAAPHLNCQLFLQCRGFQRIENLEDYVNLKVLWLEQNAITELNGLETLQQLVSLFVQNNIITSLRTLPVLSNLRVLNVSHNYLTSLAGLAQSCGHLETLQISHNLIGSLDACNELWELKGTLTSVDLSFNKIELGEGKSGPVEFFTKLPNVSVIYFHGNPAVCGLKGYRRQMVLRLPQLMYLDERPVFTEERRCVEAWGSGGEAAEAQERAMIQNEKKKHLESCVSILSDRMEENRALRDKLTKQWEEKRALELECLRNMRREFHAQREELTLMEERCRPSVGDAEVASRLRIEEEFRVTKITLDAMEKAHRRAYDHEKAMEAVQEEALKEIEEEFQQQQHQHQHPQPQPSQTGLGYEDNSVQALLMSDEEMLQEMEEEILRVLEPLEGADHVSRTTLKLERAVDAVASRLCGGKRSSATSHRVQLWKKFAQWEMRLKE